MEVGNRHFGDIPKLVPINVRSFEICVNLLCSGTEVVLNTSLIFTLISTLNSKYILKYPLISTSIRSQGRAVFAQVATYAAVLDRLNGAILKDWKVLEACHAIWADSHSYADYYRKLGPFVTVKYSLIDILIETMLSILRSGSVEEYGELVSTNIASAQQEDLLKENIENSLASEPLVMNWPGKPQKGNKTGAGPTQGCNSIGISLSGSDPDSRTCPKFQGF